MRILANSVITDADITATNALSFAGEEKLQIYQLDNKFKSNSSSEQIDIDFGENTHFINYVALCGTNLSETATVTVSYSNTDISTPDNTVTLDKWSTFNQIMFIEDEIGPSRPSYLYPSYLYPSSAPVSEEYKRYWRITIDDPNYQGGEGIEIGYLAMGKYIQLDNVEFPHTPTCNLLSELATSATLQEYGTDVLNYWSGEWTVIGLSQTEVYELFRDFVKSVRNTNHFVLVEYESSYDNPIYPPHYGIMTTTSHPYAADGNPNYFNLSFAFEERF